MTIGTMVSRTSDARVHPVSVREELEHSWLTLAPTKGGFSEFIFHKRDWEFAESEPQILDNQAVFASLADGSIFSVLIAADNTYIGSRMKVNDTWYVDLPTRPEIRPVPMPIKQLGGKFKIIAA